MSTVKKLDLSGIDINGQLCLKITWHHSLKSSKTTRVAILSQKLGSNIFLKVIKFALHGYIRDYVEFLHKTKRATINVKCRGFDIWHNIDIYVFKEFLA